MIDLRSDTVTKPTPEMRQAMARAEVGDDVFGEDPTVNLLQEKVAGLLGKEEALLVTSGTQGNQVSILTSCLPGSEVIVEQESHIFLNEAGAAAALAGVQLCPVQGERGALTAEGIRAVIREEDIHHPRSSLICLENTHNFAGGAIIPLERMQEVYRLGLEQGIPVHLDGARLFNAAVATGIPVKEYARNALTVQICLSKGLAAPVGSVIAGPRGWIADARRWRKRLGGGMRQAGIIAAAGLVALDTMVDRLAEDHARARFLAEQLAEMPGVELDPSTVETNIVIITLKKMAAAEFVEEMRKLGVLIISINSRKVRFTTHKDVSRAGVEQAVAAARQVLR